MRQGSVGVTEEIFIIRAEIRGCEGLRAGSDQAIFPLLLKSKIEL